MEKDNLVCKIEDNENLTCSIVEKEYVTWKMVEDFVLALDEFIKDNNFNGVFGPAKGGLTLAVMIAHQYTLPFLGAPQRGCLVVDDIVDTGYTALAWQNKGYKIASMYYKKNNLVTPDFWLYKKTNKWIQYPWEGVVRG